MLIVRVHPEILHSQRLPDEAREGGKIWARRYQSIVDLERHLHRNGTRVVKFFLHLSRDEQRRRFLARVDSPDKNWKFSEADLAERDRWGDYMGAYEACLHATSTDRAPWYVVPADDESGPVEAVESPLSVPGETARGQQAALTPPAFLGPAPGQTVTAAAPALPTSRPSCPSCRDRCASKTRRPRPADT